MRGEVESMKHSLLVLLLLTGLVLANPALQSKKIQEKAPATRQKPAYSVRISYPDCPAGLALAQKELAAFRKDFQELAVNRNDGQECSLELGYTTLYNGPSLISIYFEGSEFMGGAHPSVMQRALILTPQGQSVNLADCFRPGDGWLKALRDYCRPELRRRKLDSDAQWQARGTQANSDNYRVVLPEARGLRVFFGDYQVCSHAQGPQEVLVPYSAVRAQIDPRGRLAFAR